MTNYYNIEIIETSTHLKATYRDKKFRKLEHLRGELSKAMMLQIGRIVPRHEDDFKDFETLHQGKISYTKTAEEKSLYSQFNSEWYRFYNNNFKIPPKFTGADGKALKGIITYLKSVSSTELEALELWKVVLDKYDTLSDFHKANCDLKYINSKLNIILNAIRKENSTNATGTHDNISL